MPYIKYRKWVDQRLEPMLAAFDNDTVQAGEVNYIVTSIINKWLGYSPNYEHYNAAIGMLEAVKLELYRRAVAPYEDHKCHENGDVYGQTRKSARVLGL